MTSSSIQNVFPASRILKSADEWFAISFYLGDREAVKTFQCHALAFVEHYDQDSLEIMATPATEFTEGMVKNFLTNCRESNSANPIKPFEWHKIDSRLCQRPCTTTLKNLDRRLAYWWNNVFVVKAFFTFGIAKTGPQHVDLIQTHAAPLIIAVPKHPERFENARIGHFYSVRQNEFDKRVLEAHSVYIIPENTIYVLITTQKSCFAVDRCESVRVARDISSQRGIVIKNLNHVPVLSSDQQQQPIPVVREKFFEHKTLRKRKLEDEGPVLKLRKKSRVKIYPISACMAKLATMDPLQTLLEDLGIDSRVAEEDGDVTDPVLINLRNGTNFNVSPQDFEPLPPIVPYCEPVPTQPICDFTPVLINENTESLQTDSSNFEMTDEMFQQYCDTENSADQQDFTEEMEELFQQYFETKETEKNQPDVSVHQPDVSQTLHQPDIDITQELEDWFLQYINSETNADEQQVSQTQQENSLEFIDFSALEQTDFVSDKEQDALWNELMDSISV